MTNRKRERDLKGFMGFSRESKVSPDSVHEFIARWIFNN
jgi:hypothetical protein